MHNQELNDDSCNSAVDSNLSFVEEINSISRKRKGYSDYINEIFLYFYIPLLEKYKMLTLKKCDALGSNLWQAAAIRADVAMPLSNYFSFYFKSVFYLLVSFFIVFVSSLLIPIYTIYKFRKVNRVQKLREESVTVVRAPAAYQKMQFLEKDGVVFLTDSFAFNNSKSSSLYSIVGFFKKIPSLGYVPFCSLVDFFRIIIDTKNTVGIGLSGYVLYFYAKRIAHKCNFEFYLHELFKHRKFDTYYTGNKEDRFALVEKRLCRKYGIRCVCIPHGLEYSYRMPGGLVGDKFYCTSSKAKEYLQKLYKNESIDFVFDEDVAVKMFSRNIKKDKERSIVFFPESREPEVNLKIMEFLVKEGFEVLVKLHVKDRIENYASVFNKVQFIESFDEAISNNICLARKSTVLVEALYNNSVSISVLIDKRDKSYVDLMFPSLLDPKILRAVTFFDLKKILTNLKDES